MAKFLAKEHHGVGRPRAGAGWSVGLCHKDSNRLSNLSVKCNVSCARTENRDKERITPVAFTIVADENVVENED